MLQQYDKVLMVWQFMWLSTGVMLCPFLRSEWTLYYLWQLEFQCSRHGTRSCVMTRFCQMPELKRNSTTAMVCRLVGIHHVKPTSTSSHLATGIDKVTPSQISLSCGNVTRLPGFSVNLTRAHYSQNQNMAPFVPKLLYPSLTCVEFLIVIQQQS